MSAPAARAGAGGPATPLAAGPGAQSAPLGRLLRSELRWVLRRPRTLVLLGLLALLPVALGVGVAVATSDGRAGGGLMAQMAGNGLVLPVASLTIALALLLPLGVSMVAADALAGESAHGTLRGLLLAPVSRLRLVGMKSAGVLAVAVVAVLLVAGVGLLTGLVAVGGGDGLLTLSGTTVGVGSALGRLGVALAWTVLQLAAVGAVALAVSSVTEHPLVVMAVTIGGLIVFGVLSSIPALSGLWPWLLPSGWGSLADVLRDPVPPDALLRSSGRAACYLAIGLGFTTARMLRRDA